MRELVEPLCRTQKPSLAPDCLSDEGWLFFAVRCGLRERYAALNPDAPYAYYCRRVLFETIRSTFHAIFGYIFGPLMKALLSQFGSSLIS